MPTLPKIAMCAALTMAALPHAAIAARYQGVVTHVTDGDTLWVRKLRGGPPEHVRIVGIDAPEICQAHGRESREALASRVLNRRVVMDTSARDGFDRTVARISIGKEDIGQWMVSQGQAWSYRFRSSPGPYREEEAAARAARAGLWSAAHPDAPRDFRARNGSCQNTRF